MWLPWLGALAVTAAVVAVGERRSLRSAGVTPRDLPQPVLGLGLAAVIVVTVLVIAVRESALPVFVIGVVVAGVRVSRGRLKLGRIWPVLGVPVLAGLFGAAVALGTLGRAWSGPAALLSHLSGWATAGFAAVAAAVVNNLPAASMLAARTPAHPFQLLIGLNLGPNLCVTGSLAWLLWLRSARTPALRRPWRGPANWGSSRCRCQ